MTGDEDVDEVMEIFKEEVEPRDDSSLLQTGVDQVSVKLKEFKNSFNTIMRRYLSSWTRFLVPRVSFCDIRGKNFKELSESTRKQWYNYVLEVVTVLYVRDLNAGASAMDIVLQEDSG